MQSEADKIKDRLRKIIKTHPTKTISSIARECGYAQSTVSMILKGDREGTLKQVLAIAKAAGISMEALIYGKDRNATNGETPHLTDHQSVVDQFENPNLAFEINKKLIELEKIDQNALQVVLKQVTALLELYKSHR
jgi:transcriptional regulator with XRE-family HTH domain